MSTSSKTDVHLTRRELEIIEWIRDGKSAWETGTILAISERTVKFHLTNIFRKLAVYNRTQAVAKAIELGLLCSHRVNRKEGQHIVASPSVPNGSSFSEILYGRGKSCR